MLTFLSADYLSVIAAVVGLVIGSFLNVVIYRLPRMMERQWARDCAELQGQAAGPDEKPAFNLLLPGSHCPSCGHPIAWHENIPVVSYLRLRGRCAACGVRVSPRYPLVELATGLVFAYCVGRWGVSPAALAWCGFGSALLTLAVIDWNTTLLPDEITLPLVWGGLVMAGLHWNPAVSLNDALWGAVAGYVSLWLVYQGFKWVTGKEGMGYGDFKLLAALGAWLGWTALLPVILMASVLGATVGLGLKFYGILCPDGRLPFGPFLAAAGATALVLGPEFLLLAVGF